MTTSAVETRRGKDPRRLQPLAAIGLAVAFGLGGGYLDLLILGVKKYVWNHPKYFWAARDALWTVPLAHAVLLLGPGLLVALVNALRPGWVSWRMGAWLFGMLAFSGAFLRLPLYALGSVALAVGVAWVFSDALTSWPEGGRRGRWALAGLLGCLGVLAAASSGWRMIQETRAVAALPQAPAGAKNVLLIVWDTVRAESLTPYGYSRSTTPNLDLWARSGVQFQMALAPAPWTYPSHTSFFTGYWPYQLDSQWKYEFDAPVPTLAEYLGSRGYQTAGFAANTNCCTYESGLNRGFQHYEDYVLSPLALLGRVKPGRWLLENLAAHDDFVAKKWIRLQSRDAAGINKAFLDWLDTRREDRPFFAYLNYYDAHDPYLPPKKFLGRFGVVPEKRSDFELLLDTEEDVPRVLGIRELVMKRDCYDSCLAYKKKKLEELLTTLAGRGLLENTLVIITSDHGESFGEHGVFNHASSLYLQQTRVPLVILGAGVPEGRLLREPVSLRDLPATVVECLGLTDRSPFPGESLANLWRTTDVESRPGITPALSEIANATAFESQPKERLERVGFQMSLVAQGRHYVRDGSGEEHLYNLRNDPMENVDRIKSPEERPIVEFFRSMLLDILSKERGTLVVEEAYLTPYRRWLRMLVNERLAEDTRSSEDDENHVY